MKKTILLGLIVLTVLFAGCSSQAPTEGTTATTEAGGETAETTQAGAATTTAQTTATTAAAGINLGEELTNLLMNANRDYMVTYKVTTSGTNLPETSNVMTYYYKGEDKTRVDSSYSMQGETVQSRFYMVGDTYASCSDMEGTWSCINIPKPNESDPTASAENNVEMSQVTRIADKVILGITTRCYHMVMNIESADAQTAQQITDAGLENWEGNYCVTDDGILLYSESMTPSVITAMEATNFKKGTSDSDFVLPAKATDMPTMGAGTGMTEEEINALMEKYGAAGQ